MSVAILPFWHLWTQLRPPPCHGRWRSLRTQYVSAHIGLPLGPAQNVESRPKPSWRAIVFIFGLLFGYTKSPHLRPLFQLAHVVYFPISPRPRGVRTTFQVVHLDINLRSHLLSHDPRGQAWLPGPLMGFTRILPIFAISAPRFGCHYPLNRSEGRSGYWFRDSSILPPSQYHDLDLPCHLSLVTYRDSFVT